MAGKPAQLFDYPLPPHIEASLWKAVINEMHMSGQQARVLACVLRGLTDKEIALACGLTRPTIRTHLRRLFDRTQTADRLQLAMRAMAVIHQLQAL